MKTIPLLAVVLINFLLVSLAAAGDADQRIAVFDQETAGGQGSSVDGLVRGLKKEGYNVEVVADLSVLCLLPCDVLYLSDMHQPGKVNEAWRKNLYTYVRAGGSVLQTFHHHILSEVGVGVQRIYGSRAMEVVPGHPAVERIQNFDASFEDHIIEKVGKAGSVLIKNSAGQPVAVAGKIGRGKVISTGLALAMPGGKATQPPRGVELALIKSFLAWLAPDVPREERIAQVIREPMMEVSPGRALTAAGFVGDFTVRVGTPGGGAVEVACDGAKVVPCEDVKLAGGDAGLSRFKLEVETPPGREGVYDFTVRAKAGGRELTEDISAEAVFAPAPENEMRGVWLHVGMDRHPRGVMAELKRLGINTAVPRIAGGTAAFFASKVQPDVQDPLAPDGDWLAETVKHARANGISLHPYVNNFVVEGRSSKETLTRLREAGRLQEAADGRPIDWFCPSQEVNLDHIEKVMVEIATKYDVDGVQYDFIRYPNSQGCFCAKCRARFERETGKPVAQWPGDVVDGDRHAEWIEFRCGRISALVERVSNRIHREAPGVKISAAVFRDWPDCRESVGQDWVRWCREGWLDFVCPMNYTLDPELFAKRAAIHRKALPPGFPVVQGIGIASGQGSMRAPAELAVQIALARKAGAAGFLGFCYKPEHTTSLFAPLKQWMPAKSKPRA